MLGRSVDASRQTLRRARRKLREAPPPPRPVARPEMESLIARLLEATAAGDAGRVSTLLAPDVVLIGDGGGLVRSINRPLAGSSEVGRFLVAMATLTPSEARVELHDLNGQLGFVLFEGGALTNVFLLEATSTGITSIYVVRNPAKLSRIAAAIG